MSAALAARWTDGDLPANVSAGAGTVITARDAFRRFRSQRPRAVRLGQHCTMDSVHFAIGEHGELHIGDYCYFASAVLLCELRIDIGSYVSISWGVTIADSDFHPIDPAARLADAVAFVFAVLMAALLFLCVPASKVQPGSNDAVATQMTNLIFIAGAAGIGKAVGWVLGAFFCD